MLLTVVSCTPTENGSFLNKLQSEEGVTVSTTFGNTTSNKAKTLYLFTDKKNKVGQTGDVDLAQFNTKIKEYAIPNSTEVAKLTYLVPKL